MGYAIIDALKLMTLIWYLEFFFKDASIPGYAVRLFLTYLWDKH